jgi:hypothetical protein
MKVAAAPIVAHTRTIAVFMTDRELQGNVPTKSTEPVMCLGVRGEDPPLTTTSSRSCAVDAAWHAG